MKSEVFIGLNSGTSGDGIDCAIVEFGPFGARPMDCVTVEYPPELRRQLMSGHYPAEFIANFAKYYAVVAARTINRLIRNHRLARSRIRAIGSHGQTLWHQPVARDFFGEAVANTLQVGCSQSLAELTGLDVVADFRPRDVAVGGQGAPLSAIFDRDFFARPRVAVIVQNIGGIANFTLVRGPRVIASDTGPGNMVLDLAVDHFSGGKKLFDENGEWSRKGRVSPELLRDLLSDPYFAQPFPKTTGREKFNREFLLGVVHRWPGLPPEDILCTLTKFTAETMAIGYRRLASQCGISTRGMTSFLYGGGAHNSLLVEMVRGSIPDVQFCFTEDLGIPGDFKEAITFAWLAKLHLAGVPGNIPRVTGGGRGVILGHFVPGHRRRVRRFLPPKRGGE